jgi:hypothetical protein
MKFKYAASLMIAIGVATFVAAAMAQQQDTQRRQSSRSRSVGSGSTSSASSSPAVASDPFDEPSVRPGAMYGNRAVFSTTYGDAFMGGLGGEEAGLANEAGVLIRKLEAADSDTARAEIKTQMSANLGKQFDARQKRHDQEIKALEAKVKKLKELVSKRQESREEIISRRLEQVLRDSQGLGW